MSATEKTLKQLVTEMKKLVRLLEDRRKGDKK